MKNSLKEWLGDTKAAKPEPAAASMYGGSYGIDHLLSALRSKAPGLWGSNKIELSRHLLGPVFLAINTLATQGSGASWKIVDQDPDDPESKEVLGHNEAVVKLFRDPNPIDDFSDILFQSIQQLSLTGLTLTWHPPTTDGVPGELYNLATSICYPVPRSSELPEGGYRVLPQQPYGGAYSPVTYGASGALIPADQVTVCKSHHPYLRYEGLAVLSAIGLQADTLQAIDTSRWSAQNRGIDPSVAVEFDASVNPSPEDIKRIKVQLDALHAGPSKVGGSLITGAGARVRPFSTIPAEMDYQSGWTQLSDFVLACYDVPKPVSGMVSEVTYAGLYSSLKMFYILGLCPLLNKLARSKTKRIIRPNFGDGLLLEIMAASINDEELIEQQVANDISAGVRTVNELRKLRGLPPTTESWGLERAYSGFSKVASAAETQGDQTSLDELAVSRTRPTNVAGRGSAGPRKNLLLDALDNHKVRGTVLPGTNGVK